MHKSLYSRPRYGNINDAIPKPLQWKDKRRYKLEAKDCVGGVNEAIYAIYCRGDLYEPLCQYKLVYLKLRGDVLTHVINNTTKYSTAYLQYANAAELISIRWWRRDDVGNTLTLAVPTVEVADGDNGKASPPATVTEYAGKAVVLLASLVSLLALT